MLSQALFVALTLWAAQLETIFSVEYGGKKYEYRITEQDLKQAPAWQPGQENPPLSPRRAIDAASKYLATLLPNGKDWRLHQVTLKPVDGYWYYVVEFLEPLPKSDEQKISSAGFHVVVLMNGAPVTAKVQ